MKNLVNIYRNLIIVICLLSITQGSFAQDKGKVIAKIYTGFYHNFEETSQPQSGFEFATGIIGYTRKIAPNVKATIIYDVTRTTNFTELNSLDGSFEGSKYTAFLKMGQIDWEFKPQFTLSVGQLLNQQYLTVQDKWWGFRYVCVTFQEKYGYGMPADFGARFTYSTKSNNFRWSISAVNGEGPFRHQDENSKFLLSTNIEYVPAENFLVKLYADIEPPTRVTDNLDNKNVFSGFLGYKSKRLMLGCELNIIKNARYIIDLNHVGISGYSSYAVFDKIKVLARLDYGNLTSDTNGYYSLIGFQYEPVKQLLASVTYRMYEYTIFDKTIPQINVNFAAMF